MTNSELENKLANLNIKEFTSSATAAGQHRIFGFTTTNIRSVHTIVQYIKELVPEYIKNKNNYEAWERWFTDPAVQQLNKQKFRRLELAKILFRNVKDSPEINTFGEQLYKICENYGDNVLNFVLHLYLLTGRYFDVDNQPWVESKKILANYTGNFISEASKELLSEDYGRLTFAMLFYNPACPVSLNIAYDLLQNKISNEGLNLLKELSQDSNSILYKRQYSAGGLGAFKKEIAVVLNYCLFKQACEQNTETPNAYNKIIQSYVDKIYQNHLDEYFNIEDKTSIYNVFIANIIMFKDIFELALDIQIDNHFVKRVERKNIKQAAFEKYEFKCFFDHFASSQEDKEAHALTYFKTKRGQTYLEGHHMIQMENSKFFEKDVDIVENIIPLCPNCHRKIHNADKNTVIKMLKLYYNNCDKNELIRKGIFVDIETLERFYGIEGD